MNMHDIYLVKMRYNIISGINDVIKSQMFLKIENLTFDENDPMY